MRIAFLAIVLLMMFAVGASAQSPREHRGYGYGFAAPGASVVDGGSNATLHLGVGGEGLVYKGLGVGGEIGYIGSMTEMGSGFGVGSANASYLFRSAGSSSKLDPFVTGGYSLGFRSEASSGFNVGGGVNYWFKERVGLRIEVRDHVFPEFGNMNLIGVRLGITFR
jgi:hypothetical protein